MDRPAPVGAIAYLLSTGLAVVVGHHLFGGEPFFFWAGAALIAFGTIGLTPWGKRLR